MRSWRSGVSLRARILLGMLAIVLVALIVFGLATVTLLRSYLLDRVDTQLADIRAPLVVGRGSGGASRSFDGDRLGRFGRPGGNAVGANAFALAVYDEDGQLIYDVSSGFADSPDPPPDVPPQTAASAAAQPDPFTVAAVGDPSFRYRVLITPVPTSERIVVMAIPINDDDATLNRLLVVEIALAAVVLAAAALVGLRVVRVGLRPLDDMTDTATEIASGDLSHRVDLPADRADEVGRLGQALNSMLSQIEAAFHEKDVSEEQLRQFVADVSHELRTPLTSIRGYAELHRRGALPDAGAIDDAMRRIEDEATRMGVLVDDLLLLARLDQGRPLEQEPVDLVAIAADAVRDGQVVEPDRSVTFEHDDTVVVIGDLARLQQVVANLLDNARVHTPPGTAVLVAVRVDGDDAVVTVADRGPGLEPEVASRVFERSFRGESSRRHHAGSGLGLSIVQAIAEAHGGRAGIASIVGQGTTFTVRLPLGGIDSVRTPAATSSVDAALRRAPGVAFERQPHELVDEVGVREP